MEQFLRKRIREYLALIRGEHVTTGATDHERQAHRDRLTALNARVAAYRDALGHLKAGPVMSETDDQWADRVAAGG